MSNLLQIPDAKDSETVSEKPRLSAIWICSPNDPAIGETLAEYSNTLSSLPCACDLTVIANGAEAEENSELLSALASASVPCRMISLHRNSDDSTAIAAGLEETEGELVALLPSYLQSDPAGLERMLEEIDRGSDFVASWRSPRVDSFSDRLKSRIFNSITRSLTSIRLHDINSGLRLMRREITKDVPLYSELDRFLPIMAAMQGYRVSEIKVRHLTERVKRGDGGLGVYFRRILDLVTLFFLFKFTRKPLRFFGLLGGLVVLMGSVVAAMVTIQRLMGTPAADRPALLLAVLLMVLGVQLFSLGLLGELIIFVHGTKLETRHVEKVFESKFQP